MSKIKGFTIIRSPRKEAERWFELYRTGSEKRQRLRSRLSLADQGLRQMPPLMLACRNSPARAVNPRLPRNANKA